MGTDNTKCLVIPHYNNKPTHGYVYIMISKPVPSLLTIVSKPCEVRMQLDFQYVCIGVIRRSRENVHKIKLLLGFYHITEHVQHAIINCIMHVHVRSRRFASKTGHVEVERLTTTQKMYGQSIYMYSKAKTIHVHVQCIRYVKLLAPTSLIHSNIACSITMHYSVTILLYPAIRMNT